MHPSLYDSAGDGGTPDQWIGPVSSDHDPGEVVFDIKGIVNASRPVGVVTFLWLNMT